MITLPRTDNSMSRRAWLASCGLALGADWRFSLAQAIAANPERRRSCILLWMSGGPSTIDLWDLKSGHQNGGPFQEIATATSGLKFCEHLPQLARWSDQLAVVRSLTTKEGDHERATHLLRTGYAPQGAIQFPWLGALTAQGHRSDSAEIPPFVSISPQRAALAQRAGGFLGPQLNPLILAGDDDVPVDQALKVPNLAPIPGLQFERERFELLEKLNSRFVSGRAGAVERSAQSAVRSSRSLSQQDTAKVFDLTQEPDSRRDAYGRNLFGQGLLLARRLVEHGVPFVDVTLDGWDTHNNNFTLVQNLAGIFDRAWAALMGDLKDRGLLEQTTIVWMGEFGRTPKINGNVGRDHWPRAFSAVLAGGGIVGGNAYGATSADGTTVEDRPVSVPDLLATICRAVGIDPVRQNVSNVNRPIRVVDSSAQVLKEVLT